MATRETDGSPKARKAAEREARLAEALRSNMKRRKAQARARDTGNEPEGRDTGNETSKDGR
jgi:hypothetical protein